MGKIKKRYFWEVGYSNTKRFRGSSPKIDKETRKLVDVRYNEAKNTGKIEDLHKIAKALLTYETLTGEEIEDIITKNKYPENKQDLQKMMKTKIQLLDLLD